MASLAKTIEEPKTEAPKTFGLEPFKPEGKTLQGVFAIEGALMVSAALRLLGFLLFLRPDRRAAAEPA